MPSLVGFTLHRGLTDRSIQAAIQAQRRALHHFPHLKSLCLQAGSSSLEVWGHPELGRRVHFGSDGAISALVGSPHGKVDWHEAAPELFGRDPVDKLEIPWDGRTVLLHINASGNCWTLWNDWLGSIPVYYARIGHGWIASTIEPVIVAAAAFSPRDIFLPALVSQFINGFCISDWTMFQGMKVVPRDCRAQWSEDEFCCKPQETVTPSRDCWETDWNELVEEMHRLAREAIGGALETTPNWILPLSSGIDSRLIAAAGTEMGIDFKAYTYGAPDSSDVTFGRSVARHLRIPWKRVDLGREYLAEYTCPWADLFGSSMHMHGMYQMQFFQSLHSTEKGPVVSGYLGDVIAGSGNRILLSVLTADDNCQIYDDDFVHWTTEEARAIFKPPLKDALSQISETLGDMLDSLQGALFQRATMLDLSERQRRFISFSATLMHYMGEVATPYISRPYARFCLSLPKSAFERRLMADVFRRYYASLAAIPGSYARDPYLLTGRYLLRRRISGRLPKLFRRGPLRGIENVPLMMDIECVRAKGWKSLWPIREAWENLDPWIHLEPVSRVFESIMAGNNDIRLVKKLQAVQCLAYRLLPADQSAEGVDG